MEVLGRNIEQGDEGEPRDEARLQRDGAAITDIAAMMAQIRGDEPGQIAQRIVGDSDEYATEFHDEAQRYNFQPAPLESVIEEPEKFIIPELMPACEALWKKNIYTVQCSNDVEKRQGRYYIEVKHLSDENAALFGNDEKGARVIGHNPLRDEGEAETFEIHASSPEKLMAAIDELQMQDTQEYMDVDAFMENFRAHASSEMMLNRGGSVTTPILEEGERAEDLSLEEVLRRKEMTELYDPRDGRIYSAKLFKEWHQRYLDWLDKK